MAIDHLSVKTGSRDGGQSARARAQYIVREGKDETGRDELAHSESGNMPEWARDDPRKYWAAADAHERVNARLFVELECPLPKELNAAEQRSLARGFAVELTARERLPYTLALRRDGGENSCLQLMISERGLDGHARDAERWFKRYNRKAPEKGGAPKTRSMRGKAWPENTRRGWAGAANRALEAAGRTERIDPRSLTAESTETLERAELDRAEKPRPASGPAAKSAGADSNAAGGGDRGRGGNHGDPRPTDPGPDQSRDPSDSKDSREGAGNAGAGDTGPGDRTVMDEAELRAALDERISDEVEAQFSAYRGRVNARLSVLSTEMEAAMKQLEADIEARAKPIIESRAAKYAEQLARGQDLIGAWGRALLFGTFLLAGVAAAAWIAMGWTELQFRWQVAKSAQIAERIAAQQRTLDRLNRGSGSLTLTAADSQGRCFVLFPADATVSTVWRVSHRPAVEVQCDE